MNTVQLWRILVVVHVPQGSILGSLGFLLYIYDIVNISIVLQLILLVNNTNVVYWYKDTIFLANVLNIELNKLS